MILLRLIISISFIVFFATTQYVIEGVCCTYVKEGPDFERNLMEQESLPFVPRGQEGWINYDNDTISISMETNEPISGNDSLRVDVQPATDVDEIVNSSWSIISTDLIPVNDYSFYNYSLDVSAKGVNQLHSKVYYFDSEKNETGWDFIFDGRDGTFKEKFMNSFLPEIGTKYLKLQMWIRKSLEPASYLIDDINIEKVKTKQYGRE